MSRAHLIGVIILTKFLKLPLSRYEAMIEKVESSPMFAQLWPGIISINPFPRAQVLEPRKALTPNTIGQLQEDRLGFSISYRHAGLSSEYVFNEGKLSQWRQSQMLSNGEETKIQVVKRQLRLINTRNRLTHMILMGITEYQRSYLVSRNTMHLRPLSQIALAQWIRNKMEGYNPFLSSGSRLELVDNSMISRLTHHISVLDTQGQNIPLRDFFPTTRDIHKRMIETILNKEKEQVEQGNIERAYTDEEIKKRMEEQYGVSVSRRTITVCRQDMRIPSSYIRNSKCIYPPRLTRFSLYYPLNMASVKTNVPETPGVYEISVTDMKVDYPLCSSGVVYIGRAKNLRKRLRDHLRPGSKNGDLKTLLSNHRAIFRYILKNRDIRAEERMICQCFILAYGSLPHCNHIRP